MLLFFSHQNFKPDHYRTNYSRRSIHSFIRFINGSLTDKKIDITLKFRWVCCVFGWFGSLNGSSGFKSILAIFTKLVSCGRQRIYGALYRFHGEEQSSSITPISRLRTYIVLCFTPLISWNSPLPWRHDGLPCYSAAAAVSVSQTRPGPRATSVHQSALLSSSALPASPACGWWFSRHFFAPATDYETTNGTMTTSVGVVVVDVGSGQASSCLLYTSPSPRD